MPLQGVAFYQGPGIVTNCFFDKYETKSIGSKTRVAGAISVKRDNPYPPKVNSLVEAIKFGYCDTVRIHTYNYVHAPPHIFLPLYDR